MTAPQPPKTYGDGHKTAQDIAAMPDAEQRRYVTESMSPEDRANYLRDTADAQVADKTGWSRLMAELKARTEAKQQADQYGQQTIAQSTTAETQYVEGLPASNTNYKAVPHPELQGYVDNGLNAGQIGEMSNGYHVMASTLAQIATTLNDGINRSQSEWQGNAADSARNFFAGTRDWADGNSKNMQLASEVTYQQSAAAQTAKTSMPAPVPFSWSDEMKSWATSNPLD
ncbi:hypothetical protein FNH05_01580, partial [Amycolatopsis rhizosphaerae]